MEDQVVTQDTENEQKKNSSMMFVGGGILLVTLVIGSLLFVKNKPNQNPTKTITEPTTAMQQETVESAETSTNSTAEGNEQMLVNEGEIVNVEGGSFYFKPNIIKAKLGQVIKIKFTSVGNMPHDFVIDELKVKSERITNGTLDLEFTPDKAGTFEFYCSVGSHRQMGMKGTLIVEE